VASDFGSGRVYRIDAGGRATPLANLPVGCAGLTLVPEAKLLVITETRENRVAAYRYAGHACGKR
jgi:sugar lactone lactonase YvrE